MSFNKKRILLTGARFYVTLDLARQFHSQGHEVFVVESSSRNVCRFSKAVSKSFVAPSARFETESFIVELIRLVKENEIDLVVPNFEEVFYISQNIHRFPNSCTIFTKPFDELLPLHSKWQFIETLANHGFKTPKTILIETEKDLNSISFESPYALKACYCRAGVDIFKVEPPNPPPSLTIEKHNPWIAQEWINGSQYCSYSVCINGTVHALSVYPVEYTLGGKGCLTFRSVKHERINQWIRSFIEKIGYTGQIAFDFIETDKGELYAIECNPRATSGVHLFSNDDQLAQAFFGENQLCITPKKVTQKQLGIGMLLYGWKERSFKEFFQTFTATEDVIFSKNDVKPFLSIPYVYGMYWTIGRKLNKTLPAAFTHDIEWNNECSNP